MKQRISNRQGKRRAIRSTCAGKKRYQTPEHADEDAGKLLAKGRARVGICLCSFANHFHITTRYLDKGNVVRVLEYDEVQGAIHEIIADVAKLGTSPTTIVISPELYETIRSWTDTPTEAFVAALRDHDRIAIVGGPKVGKTTLGACVIDRRVLHTDEFMTKDWGDQPQLILEALADEDRFVVEGVQVARALRKGLEVDVVIVLTVPRAERTPRQAGLGKAVHKWLGDWLKDKPERVDVVWCE